MSLDFDRFRHVIEQEIMAREETSPPDDPDVATLRTLLAGLPPCAYLCLENAAWMEHENGS